MPYIKNFISNFY